MTEPKDHTVDFASIFRRISTGVYVVGVAQGDRHDAFTAACVLHISYSPLMLLVGVNPNHRPYSLLGEGSSFAVSVLKEGALDIARDFGSHHNGQSGSQLRGHVDKLGRHVWRSGLTGAPILEDAIAYFECLTTSDTPAGDHRVIVGTVIDAAIVDADAAPMLYAQTGDLDGSRALYSGAFEPLMPPAPILPGAAP